MKLLLFAPLLLCAFFSNAQDLSNLQSYSVNDFYNKIDLDYGSLDEDGRSIDFIFVKTDMDYGTYKVKLSDGPSDLYQINGDDLYIKISGYFGYAGYGKECILKVEGYSSKVYKLE